MSCEIYSRLASLLEEGKFEHALNLSSKLSLRDPKDAKILHYLGASLYLSRRFEDAIDAYTSSIQIMRDPNTCFNLGQAFLMTGRLEKGFKFFESRIKIDSQPFPKLWKGEDISGKNLVVLCDDGGFGDVIQFIRYLPHLKNRHCKVSISLKPELQCIFQHLGVPILQEGKHHCDLVVFIGSLPYCFRTSLSNIPPPAKIAFNYKPMKGRVGIVWKSSLGVVTREGIGGKRSMELFQLGSLLRLSGIKYVCAQKFLSKDEERLLEHYGVERPPITTFADTVKVLAECEQVISVDTSVAHLAGSMGIPTSILLPYNHCWRWFSDRRDSPWYPSIRIFRQKKRHVWDDPIKDVESELSRVS